MKVLFDNCTSPVFASTLHGYISHFGHEALHIKDMSGLTLGRSSPDIEWISLLKQAPERWMFISGDGRVLRNPAERAALRSAGLHGFILAPAYQRSPLHLVAATLVQRWPDMLNLTDIVSAPSMHEVPIGKHTKLRPLPL
ncbi:hypothetical protein [Rhizobium sp. SL42]|uniref:PIN-like domain-containing protein n=1 Tax=Rhizobium sp. SL42 TaxID=2806346 RepID=UPI001F489A8F|nr:hypothetical protein [Rhizobium sp. SL42]UJW75380.1 hypothetical protein IM739_02370 [Rhizobium sp. SL42]